MAKSNTGLIIGIVVAILVVAFLAISILGSSFTGGSLVPSVHTVILYPQGQVFSLSTGGVQATSFSLPEGAYDIILNGSYTSSDNTEAYILNSVQYGAFTQSKDQIQNYIWYSGSNHGSTASYITMPAGGTYYLVFYSGTLLGDTVTIVNPFVLHYTS